MLAWSGNSCTLSDLSVALVNSNFSFSRFLTSSHNSLALSKSCLRHCQYFSCLQSSFMSTFPVLESRGPPCALCNRRRSGTPLRYCRFRVQYAIRRWMNCDFLAMVTKEPISWMRSGGIVGISITGVLVFFFASIFRAWFILDRASSFFNSAIKLRDLMLVPIHTKFLFKTGCWEERWVMF